MWGGRFLQRVYTEFFPVKAVGVNEVGDFLKNLECDGLLEGVLWRVGVVEFIPANAVAVNKVGDCAEGLKQYGVLEGYGLVCRRERPVYL